MQADLTWNNVYHMIPKKLIAQLGNDQFNKGWNG